ncbi:polysialyltransferase family glycosyltransferase [Pontibacter amylolyticus]|uniref:Capsular biosynthesis protein n=1 Tax=Pontibacter amylolyticus TaxID=1424080 RepID=A0ABQ1WEJ5_9BACT|nr:polysialyltransferase family glycosyltransferase [Pontibacter amylolyticus]GGG25303.1 hypothetical protein GCM10011323_31310 [Pontibacter amylolyticus]
MAKKQVVLLNFNYSRKQWVNLLKPIFTEEFEIHWISKVSPKEENSPLIKGHTFHYWDSYSNGFEVIDSISPQAVIFMDISSGLSISLNYAAKKRGIKTLYLQHGIFNEYADYMLLENLQKQNKNLLDKDSAKSKFSTFHFLKKTLGFEGLLYNLQTIIYLLIARKRSYRKAAKLIKDKNRIPSYYLCYSLKNAQIHVQLDGEGVKDKVKIVGNPELEQFFEKSHNTLNLQNKFQNFCLLIDQPLSGGDLGESFITREKHIQLYIALAEKAKSAGMKLVVKLHPGNFKEDWHPVHDNIIWIREEYSIIELIKEAKICFGVYSAATILCFLSKPTVLIKFFDLKRFSYIEENNLAQVVTFEELLNDELLLPKLNSQNAFEVSSKVLQDYGWYGNPIYNQTLRKSLISDITDKL